MIQNFRGVTGSGDWMWGQGNGSYFRDGAAIAADIKTSVLFYLNDFFAAMDRGIDWRNLLGSKNPQAVQNILMQVRKTIININGVVRINSVVANVNSRTRRLTVSYNVSTVFSPNVVGQIQTP